MFIWEIYKIDIILHTVLWSLLFSCNVMSLKFIHVVASSYGLFIFNVIKYFILWMCDYLSFNHEHLGWFSDFAIMNNGASSILGVCRHWARV